LLLAGVGLGERARRPVAELSHGDRRLLEIAMALAAAPRLLLLDEPTAGMGSGERERVLAQIRRLSSSGRLTLLLVEHDMDVIFGMATRIVVLHQGKVLADGTPEAIRADARVREIYLGEAGAVPAATATSAAGGASYVPDDRRIFPDLTARENLRVPRLALRRKSPSWSEQRVAELFPPLAAAWHRKGRHLSGGEQKMLAIGRALMTDPALLLLDEPSEGLGPLIVRILVEALERIRAGGV